MKAKTKQYHRELFVGAGSSIAGMVLTLLVLSIADASRSPKRADEYDAKYALSEKVKYKVPVLYSKYCSGTGVIKSYRTTANTYQVKDTLEQCNFVYPLEVAEGDIEVIK